MFQPTPWGGSWLLPYKTQIHTQGGGGGKQGEHNATSAKGAGAIKS
jgi:hypothetical protein